MRALRIIPLIVHALSVLMMIAMVAIPSFLGFIVYVLLGTHVSILYIAVAILLLDGLALLVVGAVRSVLPAALL